MDKKVAFSIAASAVSLVVSMDPALAGTISNQTVPTAQTISASGYVVSTFTFTPSANVALNYDATQSTNATNDTAVVTSVNMTKGSRNYGGSVGATSSAPRACQTTDLLGGALSAGAATLSFIAQCTN